MTVRVAELDAAKNSDIHCIIDPSVVAASIDLDVVERLFPNALFLADFETTSFHLKSQRLIHPYFHFSLHFNLYLEEVVD